MRYTPTLQNYALALICVTLLGAGCAQTSPNPDTEPTVSPTPISTQPVVTPTSTSTFPEYPEVAPTVRPRPTDTVCDAQNFICVPRSLVNSRIASPITASGTAIAFESTFQWKLLSPTNQLIAEGVLMAAAPDIGQPGPFNLSQTFTIPNSLATGTLRFYESSAKDGLPIHLLNIPVRF
ncbi:Gmad2 immunoglobulin-like domain-containing protein [Patescibacteria group bacterium]|nr:Gmad2 immunoglobulin-like domain-containing protein [Patescibacteria group bacterium]